MLECLFDSYQCEAVGGKFACAVNSCTAALHLAVEALGLGPGDKVLVPTMTFTATAEVLRHVGAIPVFLDIEYGTCLLTPALLEMPLSTVTMRLGLRVAASATISGVSP